MGEIYAGATPRWEFSRYNLDMAKSELSALTEAADAFDAALNAYARLGELFLKAPLDTLKHLERANATLGELAESEQRLQETGQRLIGAVAAARDRQQQLSADIVARAPALQARNGKLGELMTALHEIAGEVGKLNDDIAQRQPGSVVPSGTGDVSTAVLALSERAEQLATDARAAEFSELAEQAHALYQRLQAIGKKLKMTGGN
jgi:DNA repair exonuclease SbcCD ATPase subunit